MSAMRHHAADEAAARLVLTEVANDYDATRARVDNTYRRMRELETARHTPADARAVADELAAELRAATVTVTSTLRLLDSRAPVPRHRLHRRANATRSVPPDVAAWSAELVRLTQIGAWLRRTTLDDPGVHVPATVRVASYAAIGPHIPGLGFDTDKAEHVRDRRIGVDLQAIVDSAAISSSVSATSARIDDMPVTGKAA
jgi:hypothetical protein